MNAKLLAGMIAIMTLGGVSATSFSGNSEKEVLGNNGPQDSRIIVEVDKDLVNLTKDEIHSSQDKVMKSISKNVTENFELVDRYDVLNNAFLLSVNKEDIEAIRNLPEVKSVTVDKIHAKKDISDGDYYSADLRSFRSGASEEPGENFTNFSAVTMNKPSGTNEGAGTVIAILDNEFYLRGVHDPSVDEKGNVDDGHAWNHDVYKPLDGSIPQKFTFDSLTGKLAGAHAQRIEGKTAGEEGSLYFNNKVPFYYDYGGESKDYGKVGPMDYDVSSTISYHGSHVASIASANADKYKGIAPNAQLACMKVFTNYKVTESGKQMGFGDSSGAYDSAILAALEDCIQLGVDGINMSLGSDLGDFDGDSISMKTLTKLTKDAGILTAISAGNAGKTSYSFTGGYGNWTTDMVETGVLGSYANSGDATIIASGQPTSIYFENAMKILTEDEVTGLKNVAFEDQIVNREGLEADFAEDSQRWMIKDIVGTDLTKLVEWQYIPGFGSATDYTNLDVKGKVAVVNRGSTSFADKYNIAVTNGAIGVVIINNDPTSNEFNFRCSFGEDFTPSVPCCLALYKDKPTFESINHGKFQFIQKDTSENDLARTISTFSSDGAKFNYDLKPDVTTPGDNIRGAVPPQKKEHREETPYSTYEFLSGTSMAAPNYAGAQSLILSKKAADVYAGGPNADGAESTKLEAFRRSIDMRLMSTANPMLDASANPETKVVNYTSPRMQGAGMVDLGKAYNTDVYLEGLDLEGNPIGKSKIVLKNSEQIAQGNLDLKFMAHNESSAAKNYTAKVTVMRPAITHVNNVVPDSFNYTGELDDVSKIPGLTYVREKVVGDHIEPEVYTNSNTKVYKDVIKLTKQIKYFTTIEDYNNKTNEKVFEAGCYYNSAQTGCVWEPLPGYDYQSVQDVIMETYTESVSIPAGDTKITLPLHAIPEDKKAELLKNFEYGAAVEGYVELLDGSEAANERQLSIPFLGFYSGAERNEAGKGSLQDAPVVEPFEFERDPDKIYPSDLVNDITKQLVGKDNVEFGSSWTVGYAESVLDVNTDSILSNDENFARMAGWHNIGINPENGEYFSNPGEHLYVGNPLKANTMIVHQFVMRSVKDNFFTIKDSDGNVVYKSALEDMLFGDKQLYKSHVDANYLSAGYVAHRAMAVIPLYDLNTHQAFKDGDYEIEFNYQLAYNDAWVKKSYNFIIDATDPVVKDIIEYTDENGVQRVKFLVDEKELAVASLGHSYVDVKWDEESKCYCIDETKADVEEAIAELGTLSNGQRRLTINLVDAAYGETNAIVHFFGSTFSNYVLAQGPNLTPNQDFIKSGLDIKWFEIVYDAMEDKNVEKEFTQTNYVKIVTHIAKWEDPVPPGPNDPEDKPNLGLIIGASVGGVAVLAGASVGIYFLIRKKKIGGKH